MGTTNTSPSEWHFTLNEQTIPVVEAIGRRMPGGFFIYRATQPEELIYVNQAVIDIFGCDDLEDFKSLTGYTFKGMLHPDDYKSVSNTITEQIGKNKEGLDHVEYRIVRKDGEVRWVEDYGHYTESGEYGGIYYVFITDVTEERQEQEGQRAEREKMITALAADYRGVYYVELDTNDAVCYQKHSETIDGLNVGEHANFVQTSSEYGKKYVDEQYLDEFLAFIEPEAIRKGLESERVVSFRYLANHNNKQSYEMIRFAGVRRPEDRDDHKVHAVSMCFSDVDAETRRNLEQTAALGTALKAAEEANKAKTAFLSNMSHEIRTPMNAIIGLDSIALNNAGISPETRAQLEKIGSSAKHLLSIINDILDMSRIESGRMVVNSEEFSLSQLLEQVNTIIGGQCRDKGIAYECRIVGDVDEYYIGDDMKLRQIMINILGNAVKFTPQGGKVTFLIERSAHLHDKSNLRFEFRDTGIGMSKEYLPKIFDTFSQEDSSSVNKLGSTGLGMSITKSLVNMMHGKIEVQSKRGEGTTFTVVIPLVDSKREDSLFESGELSPEEMSVLVIDDDPVACEHAQLVLGQVGISCDVANSGVKGIEMVRLHHARQEPYNLILVDWRMPKMDGIETTRRIRADVGYETPIIILTSYNWDEVMDEALTAGVDTFVPKPLFASTVLDEFDIAFKKKRKDSPQGLVDLDNRRILIAEDAPVNAEIMTMVLAMRNMQSDVATNGKEAVDKFLEHEPGYYDAILMDMCMPVMDGLEATRTIRALSREDAASIPIIALTANAFDEDVQRSMHAGLNAHLSKPVDPENVYKTLATLIQD